MTFTEALAAATGMVERYPQYARDAGKSYLGALAEILGKYPRQIALRCALIDGITAQCKFLPTVADIVAWCERGCKPLYDQFERETRARQQYEESEREKKLEQERKIEDRPRLTVEQLKEKYGDWHDNWRPLGLRVKERRETARAWLIAQIGEEAFNNLPDAGSRRYDKDSGPGGRK